MNRVAIAFIPEREDETIVEFLTKNFPKKVAKLWLDFYATHGEKDYGFYEDAIKKVVPRIATELCLNGFDFSKESIIDLFYNARNLKTIRLTDSTLETEELEFKNCKYRIKEIDLDGCGQESKGNWSQNLSDFKNLLAAIANCKAMKKSLQTIWIRNCDITQEAAIEALEDLDLGGVNLFGLSRKKEEED